MQGMATDRFGVLWMQNEGRSHCTITYTSTHTSTHTSTDTSTCLCSCTTCILLFRRNHRPDQEPRQYFHERPHGGRRGVGCLWQLWTCIQLWPSSWLRWGGLSSVAPIKSWNFKWSHGHACWWALRTSIHGSNWRWARNGKRKIHHRWSYPTCCP